MRIAPNAAVTIDYRLTDDSGAVLDSSREGAPLTYLHGQGQMVPGLEKALEGREAGETLQVTVAPEEGFGAHDPENVRAFPRSEMPDEMTPQVGMQVMARGPAGERIPVWITQVTDTEVTFDGNHPFAGKTLHFAVEVKGVRAATPEELTHGHTHGPDGKGGHGHAGHGHGHGHGGGGGEDMPEEKILEIIKGAIEGNRVAVFMKGTPERPACGFSAAVVDILNDMKVPFTGVNALQAPSFRHVLSRYSSWPTLPQVFLDGKLLGGTDIIREMKASGELDQKLAGLRKG